MMISLVFFWSMLFTSFTVQDDFLSEQKRYSRVRTAFLEKEKIVRQKLQTHNIEPENMHLLITAFKDESQLEIWAKSISAPHYAKIATYAICAKSGHLGPKRKQGDYQVPEGFYHIDRFNPSSNFHLSLGINYPNLADRRKSTFKDPGGDIFIHGDCVTVGCLPMTADAIREIYLFAIFARAGGQRQIPVYIFPFKMNSKNVAKHQERYQADSSLIGFWKNLKEGYDFFEAEKKPIRFTVSETGDYLLSSTMLD